jgi:2-oxoisovalerate dehydrogenase E1 component alpha subunit
MIARQVPVEQQRSELPKELLLRMYDHMLMARLLEERLMGMQRQGDGYFWIGGPGEEAFNVALGLLVDKGKGPAHDYLHLHYRSSATLLALGADPIDALRQMKNVATDPYSGGRNFVNHYSFFDWNVVPVSSPIEVQYSMAPGTAIAQKRHGGRGITIVQGGDAGTAEGDFATCLVWASRPANPLPILMIVTNNLYGISTQASDQHGEKNIADRATAFGIESVTIDGNDPEQVYLQLGAAMEYVRTTRRPFLLEAKVSRLHGHSSSSGGNYVDTELDCLTTFEGSLQDRGFLTKERAGELRAQYTKLLADGTAKVRTEPQPTRESAFDHVFATENKVGAVPGGVR